MQYVVVGFGLTLESVNVRRYVAIRSARRNGGGERRQVGGGGILSTFGSGVWRSAPRKRRGQKRR